MKLHCTLAIRENHMNSCSKSFLITLNFITTVSIGALPDVQSTMEPEFKSVTPEAMSHYGAIKIICACLKSAFETEIKNPTTTLHPSCDYLKEQPCPNPACHKTKRGLLLDVFDDRPHRLWSPWGGIELTNEVPAEQNAPWQRITKLLLAIIGTSIFDPDNDRMSGKMITYKILSVYKYDLPEPEKDRSKLSVNVLSKNLTFSRKIWDDMEKEYQRTL